MILPLLFTGAMTKCFGQEAKSQQFESGIGNRVIVTTTAQKAYFSDDALHLVPGGEFELQITPQPLSGWQVAGEVPVSVTVAVSAKAPPAFVPVYLVVFKRDDEDEPSDSVVSAVRVIIPEVVSFSMTSKGPPGLHPYPFQTNLQDPYFLGGGTTASGAVKIYPAGAREHFKIRLENWVNSRSTVAGQVVGTLNGRDVAYSEGLEQTPEGEDRLTIEREDIPGIVNSLAGWQTVVAANQSAKFDFRANVYLQWAVAGQEWNSESRISWSIHAKLNADGTSGGDAVPIENVEIHGEVEKGDPEAPPSPLPAE